MQETKQEPRRKAPPLVQRLTYVLGYDDLLSPGTRSFRLGRGAWPLILGRGADETGLRLTARTLAIPDGFMSGRHATIERRGTSSVVVDAGSRNGTWVNGARVTEHRLMDGDLIEVGHSMLCYRDIAESMVNAVDELAGVPCLGPTPTHNPELAMLGQALAKIGPSAEPVLILAPTGAGKEMVAGAVHTLSGRTGELRSVDCGAVPDNLAESRFFGHKRGAFTGADEQRAGEIERADGGTLFLDEVGNMTPALQAKLLRAIETGTVTPVGGSECMRVDVRWIAATNRELLTADDDFRSDLVRRLAGYVARLPPLVRRREDLGELTCYLLRAAGVERASIAPAAARTLFCNSFAGNIRQLRATLRSAALLAGDETIAPEHLPSHDAKVIQPAAAGSAAPDADTVTQALAATGGNVVQAAERLGTHARQVYRWIERHGIDLGKLRS